LLDRHCPHRRADLSFGFVEKEGIRCNYHGWLMDEKGGCVEQPFEDTFNPASPLRKKCTSPAYPVREVAGLLWTYLGPDPAPELPIWDPFTWQNGFREVVCAEVPCNWFQCQENSIDPVHFEWMHDNWGARLKGRNDYSPRHLKLAFDEFEYGLVYRRAREDSDENSELWTIGRVCLWPNALFTGNHFEWRVPIDDTNTLSVGWFFTRVPKEREPFVQNSIPYRYSPIVDEKTGRWITSHIMNQDFVTWVGQGRIADRSREYLAPSDRGIVMIRRRFLDDIEAVRQGREPKGMLRDPAANRAIRLPVAEREALTEGFGRADLLNDPLAGRGLKGYIFQVGQPAEVREAFLAAMGFTEAEVQAARPPADPTLVPGGR
jgi:5,5'-dehydrodivanillate O-demethylase